jgi:Ap4A phosphorylase N-terminal domain
MYGPDDPDSAEYDESGVRSASSARKRRTWLPMELEGSAPMPRMSQLLKHKRLLGGILGGALVIFLFVSAGTSSSATDHSHLLAEILQTSQSATAAGLVRRTATSCRVQQDAGLDFLIYSASARKSSSSSSNSSSKAPTADPFAKPDPRMVVKAILPDHILMLNKSPVLRGHAMLVTAAHEEQSVALTASDMLAWYTSVKHGKAVGFYNSAAEVCCTCLS